MADTGSGWGTAAIDFNHDSLVDIVATSQNGRNYAFVNTTPATEGGGPTFSEVGLTNGLGISIDGRGMANLGNPVLPTQTERCYSFRVSSSPGSASPLNPRIDASGPSVGDVTVWLDRWACGERDALNAVLPQVYDELREVARRVRRRERPGHTLATTALVHEAYLSLARRRKLGAADRAEFLALAGLAMRRILVDHARARLRAKRGAGAEVLPLESDRIDLPPIELPMTEQQAEEMLDVDRILERLRKVHLRAAWVVQQRIFLGATVNEIARTLEVSAKTVQRDWNTGIAWLRKEVRSGRHEVVSGHLE